MSSSSSPAPSVVERVQSFVSEHKRVVLLGAAVAAVAIGGAAYYASTSRGDSDKAARKREKKKASKKRKAAKDGEDGPILEEIEPKAGELPDGACCGRSRACRSNMR